MKHKYSIRISGRLMDLSTPKVMGILNLTPDSFYSGSRVQQMEEILSKADEMAAAGVDFLDVGGYSSRPGASDVPQEEELRRVVEPIRQLHGRYPLLPISIDTFRSTVAEAALDAGAALVNDISGGHLDPGMWELVAAHQVPYIAMHMRGTPQTMKKLTKYDPDPMQELMSYFAEIDHECRSRGIVDLILDPGFGFAKTIGQNYYLLKNLRQLTWLERPLLVGLSRKSMIWKTLKVAPEEALNGTTALHTVALLNGASVLRVHDARAALETVQLINTLNDTSL